MKRFLTAFLGLVLIASAGCSAAKAEQNIVLTAADLPATAGLVGAVWQSSDFYHDTTSANWISYPARATITIPHALGHTPANVAIYLSFSATGEGAGIASGDLAHIMSVTNAAVTINNGTNEDFFIRVAVN